MADSGRPSSRAVWCSNCRYEFPHQPGGSVNSELRGEPCPCCGDTRKTYDRPLSATSTGTAILSWEATRSFLEVNKGLITLVAVVGFISSFIGLIIPGLLGALVSLIFTVLGFVVGLYAVTRVREITRS